MTPPGSNSTGLETAVATLVPMLQHFFSALLMTRLNKLECFHLAKTFQSSLTFVGNTRSLPKKEASERHSNWVGSGLALKF
jgi:hypothetical protein